MRRQVRFAMSRLWLCLLPVAICGSASEASGQGVVYVDQNATGPIHDGASWCNAFLHLQDAIGVASAGTTIRVADGTYKPDQGVGQTLGDRNATFLLITGVALEGGYAGCGAPDPDDRDIDVHETILSGDLAGDDGPDFVNYDDNALHVVTVSSIDATGVIEGFKIAAGNAIGVSPHRGGGMVIGGGAPTIRSCEFVGNKAHAGAGVMVACCGGGPTFTNCTFGENVAGGDGGGLYVQQTHVTLINCLFRNNEAGDDGGGIIVASSNSILDLSGCTFRNNTAGDSGGGVYVTAGATATVANSVLWDNADGGGFDSSAQVHLQDSTASVSFSCIQGGWSGPGGNNISDDPLFLDSDGADDIAGNEDDNLRLSPSSPAIDAGDNSAVDDCQLDLDSNTRRQDDPGTTDTGNGDPPVVDMGAYEFGSSPQDCNGNGIPDACDIVDEQSTDFNQNGIPDECDVIVVNSLADPGIPDDGLTTLREAIDAANVGGGYTITFDPALAGGTIQPTSQLPAITGGNITIDGDTDNDNIPDIEIDGSFAGDAHGVRIASSDNMINGLIINRFQRPGVPFSGSSPSRNTVSNCYVGVDRYGASAEPNGSVGIWLHLDSGASHNTLGPGNIVSGNALDGIVISGSGSSGNHIIGNRIGTNVDGTAPIPNGSVGVWIRNGAANNTIGPNNLISGNDAQGIVLSTDATANRIIGNRIGTDVGGTEALGNLATGIVIRNGATGNVIGPGNVISGNGDADTWAAGVAIGGPSTRNNTVLGNVVGTNAEGTQAVPNSGDGIHIYDGASENRIGGPTPSERNIISGNGRWGIAIGNWGEPCVGNTVENNSIGLDITGTVGLGNSGHGVLLLNSASGNVIGPGNVVSDNEADGVRIEGSGAVRNTVSENSITVNDAAGINLIGGANMGIESPRLRAKVGDSLFGTSDAPNGSIIEVFSDADDEGEWLIGSTNVASGAFTLTTSTLDEADNITATVTDPDGNTSEFSIPVDCYGTPEDPDSDGDGIPDHCEPVADCNGNGILDLDEIEGAGGATVFASGIGAPEEILASSGDYPSGFFVTGVRPGAVYNVSSLGGTVTTFASGFNWPLAATIAPHEFGNEGERLFVADSGVGVLLVAPSGTVTPFTDLRVSERATGLVYIPQALGGVAGGKLLVTSVSDNVGLRLGSIFVVDADGIVTSLIESVGAALWTPTLAPDDFGDYANHVFVGESFGPLLYALDLTTLALEPFANVPLPEGEPGLRQVAFSPIGWAESFDPTLANERVLLVSVASECCGPPPRGSVVSVWDQRGTHVATLSRGPDRLPFEPRGLLFVKNDLLISDLAIDHDWLFRVTADDFGLADCDDNRILDECQLAEGSVDCSQDGVLDTCQVDCTGNGIPDQCDLLQGTSQDCNGNFIPDSCEVFSDCNGNGVPDICDLESGTSFDCNQNGLSDDCELVFGFPTEVSENTTGFSDSFFTATPDGDSRGLAGQAVTFDFEPGRLVINMPGPDLTVYENGGPAFDLIDVLVSEHGQKFFSVKASETSMVRIPGDEMETDDTSGRSYDLSAAGLDAVRFVRIDGSGDAVPDGTRDGFLLDAIGAIHLDGDCDGNGTQDSWQENDFDGDGFIDPCDLDIDNDGVLNDLDDCNFTPLGVPTDQHGRPRGDWDGDCTVTLADYELLAVCLPLSGPNVVPPFSECLIVFDADEDEDIDLKDVRVVQQTFGVGQ